MVLDYSFQPIICNFKTILKYLFEKIERNPTFATLAG